MRKPPFVTLPLGFWITLASEDLSDPWRSAGSKREKPSQEEKMNRYRKTAIMAGVLFITATVASLLSIPFSAPMNEPNYLVSVAANANQVTFGVLLKFVAAAASASIAIALYPLLRKYHEGLALGAVGFRLIEGVFYIAGVMCLLVLVTVSQEFAKAGAANASYYQTLGVVVVAAYNWVGNVGSLLAFSLGALMYYAIFYHTRLVPRWLSGWGLVGAALCLVIGLFVMLGLIGPMSTFQVVLALPIAVQEMVLAVWLIVRGFKSSAIASLSAKNEAQPPVAADSALRAEAMRL